MKPAYDVVIVGGAVIGSAVAYFLAANPDFDGSILVVERDPTYRFASTALSASSIRMQFSNPVNVKISQFGSAFIRDFAATMKIDRVNFKKAVSKKRFRSIRTSFYRMHRQYILYGDNRVPFDYMLRLFGPFRARDLAETPELADRIDPQGNLV